MAKSEKKLIPFVENAAEATLACAVTMVQGKLLALGVSHWIIATQTGLAAGLIMSAALLIWKTGKRWMVSLLLGVVTAAVDYVVHPGMFGSVVTEAVVTGLGAAALSMLLTALTGWLRDRRARLSA